MVANDEVSKLSAVVERVLAGMTELPDTATSALAQPAATIESSAALSGLDDLRARVAHVESMLGVVTSPSIGADSERTPRSEEPVVRSVDHLHDHANTPTWASLPVPESTHIARRSSVVFDALERMIVSGEVRPGDRLPPERELAERFGVGRNSIREAIRQLAMLGLVEAYQGGGTFVIETTSAGLVRPFLNMFQLSGAAPEKVLEFRLIFEPTVAALAALRRDDAAIERLDEALVAFEVAIRDHDDQAAALDTRFHHMIAEATGNPVISAVEGALMELLHTYRRQALARAAYDPSDPAVGGHREVLNAIVGGDLNGAADAMRDHLKASILHMRSAAHRDPSAVD